MKEIPLHPLSVAALFLQTPPKHRFHALKPALRDSFRHGYIRKRFLQRRAGSSLIQHCLLQIAVCFDCRPRLYREPIMPQSRIKRTRLVFSVFLCPKTHSAILQRTPLIHRPRSVHLECLAKPLTFRTCPFFGVIGKLRARQLIHAFAAYTAVHIDKKISAALFRGFKAVRRANGSSAMRTIAYRQLFVQHAQFRINVRDSAHSGTWVSIRPALRDAHGRRNASDAFHLRLSDSLQVHRLQILPLAFIEQYIDQQRGFS